MYTHLLTSKKFLYFAAAKKIVFALALMLWPAFAQAQSFDQWLADFRDRAARQGVSSSTINRALSNIGPNDRVIELDRNQPSSNWTFEKYYNNIVNDQRIAKGRRLYRENYRLLKRIEAQYGVPAHVVVALWGIESNFGDNMGGFDVIQALATLGWEGRRGEFFSKELIAALEIIDQGHITRDNMIGSWAGAMGQCQFMPTSFMRFAQDGNNDGRKDIWNTRADVFASASNYLRQNGWNPEQRWGRRVVLPRGFSENLLGKEIEKPLAQWRRMGVTQPNGAPIPVEPDMTGSIIAPDGLDGPAFIIYDNFRVIMSWNNSTYFATSVGLLANAIAQ